MRTSVILVRTRNKLCQTPREARLNESSSFLQLTDSRIEPSNLVYEEDIAAMKKANLVTKLDYQLEKEIDSLIRVLCSSISRLEHGNATLELLLKKVRSDSKKARRTWEKAGFVFHQGKSVFMEVGTPKGLVC